MTFLIIALLIALLLLSWKYIQTLEPAGVFAVMWIFFVVAVLLVQNYIELRFDGILFIVVSIITFISGTIFCDTYYRPTPSGNELTFKKKWALPLVVVLFIGAMVNPLYSIVLHGFSLQALLDMREVLEMNKGIAEDRYAGAEAHNMVNQFFLIFCYAAPLFGGFCYRWVNKFTKTICILTLIPGMFIALTQSMKMGMITGFILWFTGYLVCSYSYGLPVKIKLKGIVWFLVGLMGFFSILFFSMVFRTGEVSEKTILDISQKFITYALGQFHCFDMWFTSYEPSSYSFGTKTFMGISNALGLEERSQGVYTEFYQIGKNGYYGISNIFTIFRSLIEDFGEAGSLLAMFILGFLTKMSFGNLVCRNNIFLNQVFITAAYAYLMWSFATSFFAYTSYIAMFFVAYIIFRFIQTSSPANAETD